jgi:hypothetical protein
MKLINEAFFPIGLNNKEVSEIGAILKTNDKIKISQRD